jgi:hypothetical protein
MGIQPFRETWGFPIYDWRMAIYDLAVVNRRSKIANQRFAEFPAIWGCKNLNFASNLACNEKVPQRKRKILNGIFV